MKKSEMEVFNNALSYINPKKFIDVSEGELPFAPAGKYFKMPQDQYNLIYKLLFKTSITTVYRIGEKTISTDDNPGPFGFCCMLENENGEKQAYIWAGPDMKYYFVFRTLLSSLEMFILSKSISLSDFSKDGGCKE